MFYSSPFSLICRFSRTYPGRVWRLTNDPYDKSNIAEISLVLSCCWGRVYKCIARFVCIFLRNFNLIYASPLPGVRKRLKCEQNMYTYIFQCKHINIYNIYKIQPENLAPPKANLKLRPWASNNKDYVQFNILFIYLWLKWNIILES